MKKTFKEFLAVYDNGFDFSLLTDKKLKRAEHYINSIPVNLSNYTHEGDCTKQAYTCEFCLLQQYLEDYAEYCLDEKKFIESYQEYRDWKLNYEKEWLDKTIDLVSNYKVYTIDWSIFKVIGLFKKESLAVGYRSSLFENPDIFEATIKGKKTYWKVRINENDVRVKKS